MGQEKLLTILVPRISQSNPVTKALQGNSYQFPGNKD